MSGVRSDWINLTREEQLQQINSDSGKYPVVIFKHSNRCGISASSYHHLHEHWPRNIPADFYFLDILNYRLVSNEIAKMYGVEHHSPQVLVISDGEVVYHTSHHDIKAEKIQEAMDARADLKD